MSDRENVLRKVQAILDKAASTEFEEERATFLAKADEMMARFAIEEFELAQRETGSRRLSTPEARWVTVYNYGSIKVDDRQEVIGSLLLMFNSLASLTGVRLGAWRSGDEGREVHAVGYPTDLDYLQMLYLNLQLHFLSRVAPRKDPALSDVENFGRMRDAGMSPRAIFREMGWEWMSEVGTEVPIGAASSLYRKMRKQYQDLRRSEGREPVRKATGSTYFRSFVQGYAGRIHARVGEMMKAREEGAKGHEVALLGRSSDLDEAFWEMYPERRPHPEDCECESCHYRKCEDRECSRPRCKEFWRNSNKPVRHRAAPKIDEQAYYSGREVANSADLSGSNARVSGSRGEL